MTIHVLDTLIDHTGTAWDVLDIDPSTGAAYLQPVFGSGRWHTRTEVAGWDVQAEGALDQ